MAPKQRKERARRKAGTGSVYESPKGSGVWWAAERIEGHLVRRRAASEQAAEAKLAELQELKRRHIDVHKGTQTYEDWLNTCHQEKQRLNDPRPRTTEFNRGLLERYIIPKMGSLILLDIRPTHIQAFVDSLYSEIRTSKIDPATGKPRHDGARTVHAAAAIIQETVTLAFSRHLIPDNPYSGIRLPRYRRKKIEPMDDVQCRAFFRAIGGDRLKALWMSYLLLGFRRGEGLGARWVSLDLEKGILKIDQQVQRVDTGDGHELVIGPPKTEDSIRELPLPRRLLSLYRERWDDAQAERLVRGADWHEHGLIFSSEVGTPIWPDNLEARFRKIRAVAGLPDSVKLHHLRHTLSTLLDECDATETIKAGILGHAKRTQTQKYTHARMQAMRKVLQAVEDRLFGTEIEGQETGT